ncbi:GNAT family N-acetyltransferase [Flagellimonas sp. 389]|uniref:GNAT family N-acetyltransferase n=1 Tax=Flagellimonas sp. 389 TaxID=2835862 RepID=UPI001BD343B0|nr:GNAT family N-acetyltransferase [Flagellimonas sp. 389]MBS9463265.1 GNAT family N-acetyltransferase [Flagellimonas sp. 389]
MDSPEPILRDATLADLPILLDFEQELIKAERPFDSTLGEDPISYYDIKQMILDDDASVVVAELDGEIIASGYAIPKKARHYLAHEQYAYLGFMYTHTDYRGMGINSKIVDELKHWSLARGLKEIRLTVYSDNVPAIRAYEKVGFKGHIIEMRLE